MKKAVLATMLVAVVALAVAALAAAKSDPPGCKNPVPAVKNPNCGGGGGDRDDDDDHHSGGSGGSHGSAGSGGSGGGGKSGSGGKGVSGGKAGSTSAAGRGAGSASGSPVYRGGSGSAVYLCADELYIVGASAVPDELDAGSRYANEILGAAPVGAQRNMNGSGWFSCTLPAGAIRKPGVLADNDGWLYPAAMADMETIGYPAYTLP